MKENKFPDKSWRDNVLEFAVEVQQLLEGSFCSVPLKLNSATSQCAFVGSNRSFFLRWIEIWDSNHDYSHFSDASLSPADG